MRRVYVTPSASSQREIGLLFDVYLRGELILASVTVRFLGDFLKVFACLRGAQSLILLVGSEDITTV